MPDSIERLVKGISVLRLLNIATFVMIAVCIIVSASIALADGPAAPQAVEPAFAEIDVYEFDFVVEAEILPNPEFDEPSDIEDI